MTCPHLEETSALFDGRSIDRTHADSCEECRVFLADATQLRVVILSEQSESKDPVRPRKIVPILVPAALMLAVALFLFLRPEPPEETGPFAGLDGGGRTVITVKAAR